MGHNRKTGIALLGASAAILAATSENWASKLGIAQSSGLIGVAVVYAVLIAIVLHRHRQPPTTKS